MKWQNGLSGNTRTEFKFSKEFEQLRAVDDSIVPETVRGVGVVKRMRTPHSTS